MAFFLCSMAFGLFENALQEWGGRKKDYDGDLEGLGDPIRSCAGSEEWYLRPRASLQKRACIRT
jgi:hypothetical protein